jgi:hypothetical protein
VSIPPRTGGAMSLGVKKLDHGTERVLRGDWPSIQLDSILKLIAGKAVTPRTLIPFSHGGVKAKVASDGTTVTVTVVPEAVGASSKLFAIDGRRVVELRRVVRGGASFSVSRRRLAEAELPRLHLVIVPGTRR